MAAGARRSSRALSRRTRIAELARGMRAMRQAHVADAEPLLGEYRVMASSGSTGTPSVYVYSRADWSGVIAMFLR